MENPGCSSLSKESKVAPVKALKRDLNLNDEFSDEVVNNMEQVGFQSNHRNGLISGVDGRGGFGAWAIFPEEVWEMILNEVVKSEDIHNVLLAFPELDKAFQKKKAEWLFGAVLPHLMTKYLKRHKFKRFSNLRLRLVSKRWNASMKSSLESHIALQHLAVPPSSASLKDDQKLMPSENHFNYNPFQEPKFGASIFRTAQQMDKFVTSMTNFSGNPFPGRHIAVIVRNSNIGECLALFEKFGEHVLFLEMKLFGEGRCHLELCKNVLKCLSHLPNLRSLSFSGELFRYTDRQADNYFCEPDAQNLFPDLPKLEALNWQVEVGTTIVQQSRWATQIIKKYGGKDELGKLGIPVSHYLHIPSNLASITELSLLGGRWDTYCLDFTNKVFKKLSFPLKLRKLSLQNWSMDKIGDLIHFLAGFKVEAVILEDTNLCYRKVMVGAVEAISVRSLQLSEDYGLHCDFVKRLPNLEFFTVHFKLDKRWGWRANFEEGIKPDDPLAGRIKAFVMKTCDKNVEIVGNEQFSIWKELPKLKMLSVRMTQESRLRDTEASVWNVQFVRECGDKPFFRSCPNGNVVLYEDSRDDELWNYDDRDKNESVNEDYDDFWEDDESE